MLKTPVTGLAEGTATLFHVATVEMSNQQEAPPGFEPGWTCFADRWLSHSPKVPLYREQDSNPQLQLRRLV